MALQQSRAKKSVLAVAFDCLNEPLFAKPFDDATEGFENNFLAIREASHNGGRLYQTKLVDVAARDDKFAYKSRIHPGDNLPRLLLRPGTHVDIDQSSAGPVNASVHESKTPEFYGRLVANSESKRNSLRMRSCAA